MAEHNPSGHLMPDGLAGGWALVGALLAFGSVAILTGMGCAAAGVADDALVRMDTTAAESRAVARLGLAAGLESRPGGGFGGNGWWQPLPGIGIGSDRTEADDQRDGKDGEFRFHGWIWF